MKLQEKTKDYFEKYPDLSVLFFFDASQEYNEEVNNWEIDSTLVIKAGNDFFNLKYKLEYEYRDKKVLLYFPYPQPTGGERRRFPLLDLLTANRILLIDEVEDFMEEYNLKPYQRDLVKRYIKYLKLKKVQKTLSKILKADSFDEKVIKKGLICYYLGLQRIEDESILLAKLFVNSLEGQMSLDTIFDRIREIDAENYMCKQFDSYFEIATPSLNEAHIQLAINKAKYNLITQNIEEVHPEDNYAKLKINKSHTLNTLNSFINDWSRDEKLSPYIEEGFKELGSDIKENEIIRLYGVDADYGYYTYPLTIKLISQVLEYIAYQPDQALDVISRLKDKIPKGYPELPLIVELLLRSAEIYTTLNSVASYTYDKPKDYVEEYISKFEAIDYNYRKVLFCEQELRQYTAPDQINIGNFINAVNRKYEEYVKELNTQWLKCLEDHDFEFNNIPVPKQHEFYNKYIAESDQKTVVIISDALRYEAGRELVKHLYADPKHQANISYMLSSLPSITKQGMANLLPHEQLTFENEMFAVDGMSTDGVENRQKILQRSKEDSRVIQFEKLLQLSQEKARELFKAQVVYIYHNVIDAIGDDRKTEKQTIDAVEKTINELVPMIKKIHSSYNVSKVYITADHGFLYHASDLPESMYEPLPDSKNAVLNHNRFSIVKSKVDTNSYVFDISKASNIRNDFKITIPKAINRYKRQGHGVHYVHGGASLQEMIIPVIESTRKREDITERVPFRLLSRNLKIVSGALKIKVIQERVINSHYKPLHLNCALYSDSDEIVSNEVNITLDFTSDLPTERVKETILTLNTNAAGLSRVYLKIFDKEKDVNKLNPLIKEEVINQSLIEPDF
jgi:uncharacterized protein (TIGR02687 family)